MVKIGMTHSNIGQLDRTLLDPEFWIKDFTSAREGFCYTLNSSVIVGTDYEKDIIGFFAMDENAHHVIYIHDPEFFQINDNAMALSKKKNQGDGKHFPISEDLLGQTYSSQSRQSSM